MAVTAPKCKLCGECHFGPLCPKFHKSPRKVAAAMDRVKEIEARPLELGSKGKKIVAKKAAKKKGKRK